MRLKLLTVVTSPCKWRGKKKRAKIHSTTAQNGGKNAMDSKPREFARGPIILKRCKRTLRFFSYLDSAIIKTFVGFSNMEG